MSRVPVRFCKPLVGVAVGILALVACRPEQVARLGGPVSFDRDSVLFDTLFTTVQSPDERLWLYNRTNSPLRLTEVRLAQGESSPFRLIFNGREGQRHTDVVLARGDSLLCLVRLRAAVRANTDLQDALVIQSGDAEQRVMILAHVLDAYLFRDSVITGTSVFIWPTDKPSVIDGPVVIDQGVNCIIPAGAALYFTSRRDEFYQFYSQIFVAGSLQIAGSQAAPVLLTNFRLNNRYQDSPGQWKGIQFWITSTGNEINHAEIRNAMIGIELDSIPLDGRPKLRIRNTKIHNMAIYGLYPIWASEVDPQSTAPMVVAENVAIWDCGQASVLHRGGGSGRYVNCTFAGMGFLGRRDLPSFAINRTVEYADSRRVTFDADFYFQNCIFWGNQENEFLYEIPSGNPIRLELQHCLVRSKEYQNNSNALLPGAGLLLNQNPQFTNPAEDDYMPKETSPARGAGLQNSLTPATDLGGEIRPNPPTIGAYEWVPRPEKRRVGL